MSSPTSSTSSSIAVEPLSTSTSSNPLSGHATEDASSKASTPATAASATSSTERLKGFAAGTASGLTKLAIGHPFDTIKTRMQCSPPGTYAGPLECTKTVIRSEGLRALYKGASPPAVGWAITDAILLGSLHNYRLLLAKHTNLVRPSGGNEDPGPAKLSVSGHALAGMLAGFTVAIAATPIELVKVKLQMQLQPSAPIFSASGINQSAGLVYHSPIGFTKQIYSANGVLGFWHATGATMLQRMWFGVMFGSYDVMMRFWRKEVTRRDGSYGPRLKEGTANFISGGLSSNLFWIFAYPFDNVKNRLMSDSIASPKYPSWASAARSIWREGGMKAVYRGFVPCFLRAFPTNGGALFVWETVMRAMQAEKVR